MRSYWLVGACLVVGVAGCGESDGDTGAGGSGGSGGTGGVAGASGSGGIAGGAGSGAAAGAAGSAGAAGMAGGSGWTGPSCGTVSGTAAVTFTSDEGATLAPRTGTLSGVAYTWGLAALDTPNVLIAEHAGKVLRSTDAGCSFSEVGDAPASVTRLVAAPGGRAYGYGPNSNALYRIDSAGVTVLKAPGSGLMGLGTDPVDGKRLRVGDSDGQIWESLDEGESFDPLGKSAPNGCFYVVAFDPANLDHMLCGTITEGAFVSSDGAQTWQASNGDATYANVFSAVISPANSNVVWIEGFQLGFHNGMQIGPEGRRIWRSSDGGLNFSEILLEENTSAKLFNGNLLAAHPSDPELLYFTFGTPPIGGLASESYLYRLTAGGGLTEHKQAGIDSYDALVFMPGNPSLIYLGLSSERPGAP